MRATSGPGTKSLTGASTSKWTVECGLTIEHCDVERLQKMQADAKLSRTVAQKLMTIHGWVPSA